MFRKQQQIFKITFLNYPNYLPHSNKFLQLDNFLFNNNSNYLNKKVINFLIDYLDNLILRLPFCQQNLEKI